MSGREPSMSELAFEQTCSNNPRKPQPNSLQMIKMTAVHSSALTHDFTMSLDETVSSTAVSKNQQ